MATTEKAPGQSGKDAAATAFKFGRAWKRAVGEELAGLRWGSKALQQVRGGWDQAGRKY